MKKIGFDNHASMNPTYYYNCIYQELQKRS